MRLVLRFGIAGGWNTCIGYFAYALCLYLGAPYYAALLASNIVATVNNYATLTVYVFRDRKRAPFLRFLAGFLANYAFGVAGLWALIDIAGVNAYLSALIVLPFMVVFSFAVNNWFVFRGNG